MARVKLNCKGREAAGASLVGQSGRSCRRPLLSSAQVAAMASDAVRRLGGRTLVLTTTLRALRAIGDVMKLQLEGSGIEVLVQGEWP